MVSIEKVLDKILHPSMTKKQNPAQGYGPAGHPVPMSVSWFWWSTIAIWHVIVEGDWVTLHCFYFLSVNKHAKIKSQEPPKTTVSKPEIFWREPPQASENHLWKTCYVTITLKGQGLNVFPKYQEKGKGLWFPIH